MNFLLAIESNIVAMHHAHVPCTDVPTDVPYAVLMHGHDVTFDSLQETSSSKYLITQMHLVQAWNQQTSTARTDDGMLLRDFSLSFRQVMLLFRLQTHIDA